MESLPVQFSFFCCFCLHISIFRQWKYFYVQLLILIYGYWKHWTEGPTAQKLSHWQIAIASASISSIAKKKKTNLRVTTCKSVDLMIEFHAGGFLFIYWFDCFDNIKRKTNKQNIFLWRLNSIDLLFLGKQNISGFRSKKKCHSTKAQSLFQINEAEKWTSSEIYFTMQLRATIQTEAWVGVFLFFFSLGRFINVYFAMPCVFCVKFSKCLYIFVVGSFYINIIHVCCEMVSLVMATAVAKLLIQWMVASVYAAQFKSRLQKTWSLNAWPLWRERAHTHSKTGPNTSRNVLDWKSVGVCFGYSWI